MVKNTPESASDVTPVNSPGENGANKTADNFEAVRKEKAKLLQTIKKLEAEIKRLKLLLEKKNKEVEDLKLSIQDVETEIDTETTQHEAAVSGIREKLAQKEKEIEVTTCHIKGK